MSNGVGIIYGIMILAIAITNGQPLLTGTAMIWMIGIGTSAIVIELMLIANKLNELVKILKK